MRKQIASHSEQLVEHGQQVFGGDFRPQLGEADQIALQGPPGAGDKENVNARNREHANQ